MSDLKNAWMEKSGNIRTEKLKRPEMDDGGGTLICNKCRCVIGRWRGPWSVLEGNGHVLDHYVRNHVCGMSEVTPEMLDDVAAEMKRYRRSFEDQGYTLSFDEQMTTYKALLLQAQRGFI